MLSRQRRPVQQTCWMTSNRFFMLFFLVVISWIVSSKSRLLPEGKQTRDASSSTFAVLSLLQNACKMCMWLFWFQCLTLFFYDTLWCHPVHLLLPRQIPGPQSGLHYSRCRVEECALRLRVIKNIKMSLYTLRDAKRDKREHLLQMTNHWVIALSTRDFLPLRWLSITNRAGLGRQWSMLFENMPANMQVHQFACSLFIWLGSIWFLFSFFPLWFVIVWSRLHLLFFFYDFFFVLFYFEGINWCFVSYSFVSVKGPGRKLSLPTDLKTDLGTVGESQQFSLDFLWVSAFLMVSRLLCCISTFGFHSNFPLSVSLLLCPPVQPAHETVGLTCSSILPVSVFWFKASVFVPSTFCKCLQRWFVAHAHIWTWGLSCFIMIGPSSDLCNLSSIDRLCSAVLDHLLPRSL